MLLSCASYYICNRIALPSHHLSQNYLEIMMRVTNWRWWWRMLVGRRGKRRGRRKGVNILILAEALSSAKHYANCFSWIVGDPPTAIWSQYSVYHLWFKKKKRKLMLSNLPEPVSGRVGTQTQTVWHWSLSSSQSSRCVSESSLIPSSPPSLPTTLVSLSHQVMKILPPEKSVLPATLLEAL